MSVRITCRYLDCGETLGQRTDSDCKAKDCMLWIHRYNGPPILACPCQRDKSTCRPGLWREGARSILQDETRLDKKTVEAGITSWQFSTSMNKA